MKGDSKGLIAETTLKGVSRPTGILSEFGVLGVAVLGLCENISGVLDI